MDRRTFILSQAVPLAVLALNADGADAKKEEKPVEPPAKGDIVLVCMDPLALELSCPCVKGYAQRNYNKLAEYLTSKIGRPVKVYFAESLTGAAKKTGGRADIVVGKHSVVKASAKKESISLTETAGLTGKDGKTTMTGLFVVAAKDPALAMADIKDHEIYLGHDDAAEKHQAPLATLKEFEIPVKGKLPECGSCTDAAVKVLDLHRSGKKAVGVVSSYAQPLLEGCGTVKKGELRVIGETAAVPFIVAFTNDKMEPELADAVRKALKSVGDNAELCKLLESKSGFVEIPAKKK